MFLFQWWWFLQLILTTASTIRSTPLRLSDALQSPGLGSVVFFQNPAGALDHTNAETQVPFLYTSDVMVKASSAAALEEKQLRASTAVYRTVSTVWVEISSKQTPSDPPEIP